MAEVQPGANYTPTLTITDGNGSPVTVGVTGTMSLYGPASAIALASGPLVHQGEGAWGATFAGSLLTALGTYRFLVPSLVTPGGTLTAQGGTFDVGSSDWWTVREVLTSVRLALRDGWRGTTTAGGTTTTLIDARYALGSDGDWLGSEIVVFAESGTGEGVAHRVTSFAAASGTFTFTPAASGTVTAGLDYLLGNRNGDKWSHDEVLDAIRLAVRRARSLRPVSDQVTLTTATNTYEYVVPADWVTVDRVFYQPDPGLTTRWQHLSPVYWRYRTDRGLLSLALVPPNNALRIEGRAAPTYPATLTGLVPLDGATVRDDVLYELLMNSAEPADRQRAAGLAGPVQRARMGAALVRL